MKKEKLLKILIIICILLPFTADVWAQDDDEGVEIVIDLTHECCCDMVCFYRIDDNDYEYDTFSYAYSMCREMSFLPAACDNEKQEHLQCYFFAKEAAAEMYGLDSSELATIGWEGEGCATKCVSESLLGPDDISLNILREFREKVLEKTDSGRAFIDLYYEYSKPVMSVFRRNPHLKDHALDLLEEILPLVRISLDSPGSGISIGKELSAEMDMLIEELDTLVDGGMSETLFEIKRELIDSQ